MDVPSQVPADVDAAVREALAAVSALPGAHRVGLALTEGAGRRLQFTSSDRGGDMIEWCHIDAFDDVPLTAVVRTGETVAGTLDEIEGRFPTFARNQAGTSTTAVVAVPLLAGGPVGGIIAFVDSSEPLLDHMTMRVTEVAATTAARVAGPRQSQVAPTESDDASSPRPRFTVAAAEEVSTARRQVRALLRSQDVDDDTIDDAVLCLSELLTNVIMHTSAPAQVEVSRGEEVVRVAVRDQGSSRGAVPTITNLSDPLRVHGRGLQLLDALSARWDSEPVDDGTVVWFELDLPA